MTSPSVRQLAFETIQRVRKENAYSNIAINQTLSEHALSNADKGLLTELVYGTLKRQYTLDFYLKPFVKTKLKGWMRSLLWMSIYQYVYLDKVPEHAIINEAVTIAKVKGGPHNGNVINGILRTMMRSELPDVNAIQNDKQRIATAYSLPMWIVEHWMTHYGIEKTEVIADNLMHPVAQTVRVNTTRVTPADMKEALANEGYRVEQDPYLAECLHVSGHPVVESQAFKEGFISIQDLSSMFVAHILEPKTDETILDACSAPGGKACHIAERLDGTGKVDATDIHDHKINLINDNKHKLQLNNVHAYQHDATQQYQAIYDKILVDAPCSGLGVLRHKPEIKYTQTQQSIEGLVDLQLEILENVKENVKPGGTLVYSTCTIEQMENENVIYTFLKQNDAFEFEPFKHPVTGEMVKTMQLLPQDVNSDGFFITRIKRKESVE
ncbi:16S rRNA (cytosine967-C5)-methyltransferase [Staphylococcus auricularis]|uniref:16S rRNA (cytosine(967)-C(5))-methyltransferase n=1 Tax=Staphylococcus auricularis TaxID=29379 RepID=A0AAW7M763_9STAP|nr:16S rRNA (cytosine(967)-C(5))-methyltransferase RsmB [Staphylococcus auricularis]MBM0867672.1 16S rRNA (cytosine(967)-C(5))-methyltransferase RsmB [Staphylococcus auricularis]MCG7340538.1 16S rRNA (cytosine(967)-C(5))-methyltransferase RsmB [Staphylococcus auricularis]MDC6326490.1 16S rRNA (cytosine(967)-C(5))-methyltransferase RsmB [Staphylococcus auricularis]MDN4532367.1 16S rRNA (cytosine(967)-C(5))-methyltransferase RsmB [Staphylococcus auricularis]HJE01024.1 16S rRNA (cytosine(967)-C(5